MPASEETQKIYREVLDDRRQWLLHKNKTDKRIDEELIRKHLLHLDMEEEKLKQL